MKKKKLSIIFNTSDFWAHVALIIEEEKYENTYQVWYGLLIIILALL